jgi:hypothetical protein
MDGDALGLRVWWLSRRAYFAEWQPDIAIGGTTPAVWCDGCTSDFLCFGDLCFQAEREGNHFAALGFGHFERVERDR